MKRKHKRYLVGSNLAFVTSAITNFMHQMNPNAHVFREVLTKAESKYLLETVQMQRRVFDRLLTLSKRLMDDD